MKGLSPALLVGLLLVAAHPAFGRTDEDDLKAALVYRFATFVEWPASAPADDPLVLCVLDHDAVAKKLEAVVEGRSVGGRPLRVERLDAAGGAGACHLVYVGRGAARQMDALLAVVAERSVLTIGEVPDFAQRGGIVELVRLGSRMAFEIHRGAAQRAGLRISPTVLKLAEKVHEDAAKEGS